MATAYLYSGNLKSDHLKFRLFEGQISFANQSLFDHSKSGLDLRSSPYFYLFVDLGKGER